MGKKPLLGLSEGGKEIVGDIRSAYVRYLTCIVSLTILLSSSTSYVSWRISGPRISPFYRAGRRCYVGSEGYTGSGVGY